jgi:signal transduction histidine kinase
MGIAADALPRVFERFYRIGGNAGDAGLGIGLFLANSIVQEHGGTIEVESETGNGSVFTVVLPNTE